MKKVNNEHTDNLNLIIVSTQALNKVYQHAISNLNNIIIYFDEEFLKKNICH